ncbi:hypothetical protein GGX14DRAFT_659941 [Mycena pura]|uniref:Uncharacterized protein n=1 Tax=Mycena pura TaxID=153505 RepID=A0AAD6V2N5_9AGAR|nr:hypothetical protein GGX14DRAFT_659941 [Mycena pura]
MALLSTLKLLALLALSFLQVHASPASCLYPNPDSCTSFIKCTVDAGLDIQSCLCLVFGLPDLSLPRDDKLKLKECAPNLPAGIPHPTFDLSAADHETTAKRGHENIVRALHELDADINARSHDKGQWTAMHVAAVHGHEKVVRALAHDLGADVNAQWTVMHIATAYGYEKVVCALHELQVGASRTATSRSRARLSIRLWHWIKSITYTA